MNIHIMLNPERDGYKACPIAMGMDQPQGIAPHLFRCGGSGLIHHPSTLSAQATSPPPTRTPVLPLFPGEPDEA